MAAPDQPPASPPPEPGDGLATDQGHGQEQERRAEPPVAPSDFNEILFARTLMSSTTIGIMAIASAGQFVFCNEAMRDMFGFPAELLQRHDAPALLEHIRSMLVDPESISAIVRSIREGGRDHWHGVAELRDGRVFELTARLLSSEGQWLGRLWLCRDITEQRNSQQALQQSEANLRAVVQEQERLIATIREIGTPVLPIYNRVLVLPLVGHIESTRSAHLMDALLESIQHHQASVVIIDITGVSLVDTSVANSLIQSTQAAALLGAHCVLVGISAAVSRTIVHLGVDLTQVTTRRDLQAGFAFALHYLGYGIKVIREEPDWLTELEPDGDSATP